MKHREKIKDFKRLSGEQLKERSRESQEKLAQLRFDLAGGKVKNVREIRAIKRDIARLKTLLKLKLKKDA